jgi:hypothetical protein
VRNLDWVFLALTVISVAGSLITVCLARRAHRMLDAYYAAARRDRG